MKGPAGAPHCRPWSPARAGLVGLFLECRYDSGAALRGIGSESSCCSGCGGVAVAPENRRHRPGTGASAAGHWVSAVPGGRPWPGGSACAGIETLVRWRRRLFCLIACDFHVSTSDPGLTDDLPRRTFWAERGLRGVLHGLERRIVRGRSSIEIDGGESVRFPKLPRLPPRLRRFRFPRFPDRFDRFRNFFYGIGGRRRTVSEFVVLQIAAARHRNPLGRRFWAGRPRSLPSLIRKTGRVKKRHCRDKKAHAALRARAGCSGTGWACQAALSALEIDADKRRLLALIGPLLCRCGRPLF